MTTATTTSVAKWLTSPPRVCTSSTAKRYSSNKNKVLVHKYIVVLLVVIFVKAMRLSCLTIGCLMAVSLLAQPSARQWNKEVTAGWNLGNQLECPPPGWNNESTNFGNPANALQAETAWGNPIVTQQTLQAVKEAGFNAVRIPVRWQCHITDATTMTIDAQWIQRVKEVVDYALDCGQYGFAVYKPFAHRF